MTFRFGLSITFLLLSGCAERTSEKDRAIVEPDTNSIPLTNGSESNASVVCGVLYKVNDFDEWLTAYNNSADGTIIIMRNVDDPSLVLVYEGKETLELAKARGVELTSDEFVVSAGVEDSPLTTNHKVEYYQAPVASFKQHVALTFDSPDIKVVLSRLQRDSDLFAKYGLTVMGVGTNYDNREEIYILLTLKDFVSFRQQTNSPRKIRKFIESLNLPKETLLSDWTKTDFSI